MTHSAVLALDRALKIGGADIVLRRTVGKDPNAVNVDVVCRARVDVIDDVEHVGAVAQAAVKVIMSPTEIAAAQWPGGETEGLTVAKPSLPRRGDDLIWQDRVYNVDRVKPFDVGGEVVRIELWAMG